MTTNTRAIADACQTRWEDGGGPVPDCRGMDVESVLVPEAAYSGRRSLEVRKSIAGGRISPGAGRRKTPVRAREEPRWGGQAAKPAAKGATYVGKYPQQLANTGSGASKLAGIRHS